MCSVNVEITGWKTDEEDRNESVQVGQDTTDVFTITITDVNEAPSYAASQTRYVAENAWKLEDDDSYKRDTKTGKPATLGSTLVLVATDDGGTAPGLDLDLYRTTATAADDPVAAADQDLRVITGVRADTAVTDRLLYTMSGPDAMYFGIYRATGQIITQGLLDFETLPANKKYFTVQVTATDRAGLSDTTDVRINVVNVNEPPVPVDGPNQAPVFPSATTSRDVEENTAAGMAIGDPVEATDPELGTLTYTLGGADMRHFSIDAMTGQLMTSGALDYETTSSYTVTVTATDDDATNPLRSMTTVTIMVTNAEETGTVSLMPTRPSVGAAITATLVDDDIVETVSWQWASGDAMAGPFSDISGATSDTYTPVADDEDKYLRATASYTDGYGSGNSEQAVSAQVSAADVNVAPTFPTATTTRTIAENTAANINIGAPVAATDPNGDTLDYTLEGTDQASFTIDGSTGQLRTLAALNFESKTTYSVVVEATDPAGLSATIDVTIEVTDVVEDVPMIVQDYDTDGTPGITAIELSVAINDYVDGGLDAVELSQVIAAYVAG